MSIDFKRLAEHYREPMLKDLFELLKIESVREDDKITPETPFGPGPRAALDKMLAFGKRDGLRTKDVDHKAGCIYAGQGTESVGILVHLDVVPATGNWSHPPFEPIIKDGRLYARGASDDKGPALSAYYGLRLLLDAGVPLNREVHFICGTDEESNWECLDHYFQKEPMPTMGFSPDADFPIINGEKGLLDISLNTEPVHDTPSTYYLQRFNGGIRSNMVPEKAYAIVTGNAPDLTKLADAWMAYCTNAAIEGNYEQNDDSITLNAYGKSAHGAEPHVGINAATFLADFLSGHTLNASAQQWCAWIRDYLHLATDGHKLHVSNHDDVMGDVTINAGIFKWQDGVSEIIINNRYPRSTNDQAIITGYKDALKNSHLTYSLLSHKPVHYVPEDDFLVQKLLDVYHRQTGLPAYTQSIGGGTYARMISRGVAYGPMFPGEISTMHQADEYALVDTLVQAIAIYAEAIYELTR